MNKRIIAVISVTAALSAAAALFGPAVAQTHPPAKFLLNMKGQTQGKVTGGVTRKGNAWSPQSVNKFRTGKPQIKPPPHAP